MFALSSANWFIWFFALWLLWLPGRLLDRLLQLPKLADPLVQFALQIGLGLAFWPLLLLWTTTARWQWSGATAQALVLALSGLLALDLAWSAYQARSIYLLTRLYRLSDVLALFGLIALLTVWTRILHIWGVALPAWVDSVHHAMSIRLLVDQGSLPESYAPFIVGGKFFYHWGYHAIVTWIVWLLGLSAPLDITHIMLHSGQLFNTLTVFMVYAAGQVLFQNRRASLLATMLAGLISWFPAFYVSWGRYPQLVGLLVLCPFGIMLWQTRLRPTWGRVLGAGILGAGLFLIHTRVVFFALTLIIILVALLLVQRAWRTLGWWMLAGLCTLLLTLPWLWVLIDYTRVMPLFTQVRATDNLDLFASYYDTQPDLLWAPHNLILLALATGGLSGLIGWVPMPLWGKLISGSWLLFLIGLGVGQRYSHWLPLFWQRRRARRQVRFRMRVWGALGVLMAWSILTALLLNLDRFGFPRNNIITNNSWIITLFVPLSLAGGGLLAWVIEQTVFDRWVMPITAFVVIVGSGWGAITMVDTINPITLLATPADTKAIEWIRRNTPENAHFAVDVWPWLGHTYAGSDGGYWIQILTDRRIIVPPALYSSAMPPAEVAKVNELLGALAQGTSLDNITIRKKLQSAGVTHIYIGAKGNQAKADYLRQQKFVQIIYQDGPVQIFEFTE